MSKLIASAELRSTDTQQYTITNATAPFTIQYSNSLDAELSMSVEGTYDEDDAFANSVLLKDAVTITSGEDSYDTGGYPWEKLRVSITPQTTPTSGKIEIRKMSE